MSEDITEHWLERHGFICEGGDWCFGPLQLRRFSGGEWRINMHDWWEYFPNQTTSAITGILAAMGYPELRAALEKAVGEG